MLVKYTDENGYPCAILVPFQTWVIDVMSATNTIQFLNCSSGVKLTVTFNSDNPEEFTKALKQINSDYETNFTDAIKGPTNVK